MIEASCHCGAIRLEVARPPGEVTDCNCSICRKLGTLWAYYPTGDVRVAGATVAYRRAPKPGIDFHHCGRCGCATHWTAIDRQGPDRMGVNARLMAPEVVAAVSVRRLDGAAWTE